MEKAAKFCLGLHCKCMTCGVCVISVFPLPLLKCKDCEIQVTYEGACLTPKFLHMSACNLERGPLPNPHCLLIPELVFEPC